MTFRVNCGDKQKQPILTVSSFYHSEFKINFSLLSIVNLTLFFINSWSLLLNLWALFLNLGFYSPSILICLLVANKIVFLFQIFLRCLYNKQNNTWLFVDMEFLFSCSTRYLTRSLRSHVRYRAEHERRNSIFTRAHVLFSISFVVKINKVSFHVRQGDLTVARACCAAYLT